MNTIKEKELYKLINSYNALNFNITCEKNYELFYHLKFTITLHNFTFQHYCRINYLLSPEMINKINQFINALSNKLPYRDTFMSNIHIEGEYLILQTSSTIIKILIEKDIIDKFTNVLNDILNFKK